LDSVTIFKYVEGFFTMDILGTAGNDNLTGTAGDDVLIPVTGAFDTVAGGAGIDTLKLDYSANQVSAIYVSQGGIQLGFLAGDASLVVPWAIASSAAQAMTPSRRV
jgi:Ca2+-binding RTX toxin-like protein